MKRVLIIGGNSYLAKSFINTYQESFSLKVLKRDESLRDYFLLREDDFKGFDVVINFAAIVHDKKADRKEHQRYNYELVKYLADLAKSQGVKHFIQISTVAVYGDVSYIDEKTPPNPTTPYGIYKLKADEYLLKNMTADFKTAIVRPTVIYGKDAPGNMRQLCKLVQLGLPLPFGYRYNQRAILCIEHFIEAISIIVEKNLNGCFLLRDETEPSIRELVGGMIDATESKSLLLPVPKWIGGLLARIKWGPVGKLFADLHIDDTKTIQSIGEYRHKSWQRCIRKLI
jgi:UDP-glucose 4-epimerase